MWDDKFNQCVFIEFILSSLKLMDVKHTDIIICLYTTLIINTSMRFTYMAKIKKVMKKYIEN